MTPDQATIQRFDRLREREFARLDEHGQIYLDYTGSGLAPDSLMRGHTERLTARCFGNPHSDNPTSSASTELVERTRQAILNFFNASPQEYAVIFTPNATGACRLVGEAYRFGRGSRLVLLIDNHNSINGIREYARARGARVSYVPIRPPDLRAEPSTVDRALRPAASRWGRPRRRGLFIFPAQSNFTGVQHPLDWVTTAHERGYDVLLDAAAFVPTNRLDLSVVKPDFVPVSWYKVFGYPTGVGCLIARRQALAELRRPWFAGGTIQAVSAQGGWHVMSPDETAFEDGTLNFLSIPDILHGLEWIREVGVDRIHDHVTRLTGEFLHRLDGLRHRGGRPMIQVYGPRTTEGRGGTVTFNVLDPGGRVVDERAVARDSSARGISVRTGCFCNPGAGEAAFHISHRLLRAAARHRGASLTLDQYLDNLGLPTGGAVRASLGVGSNRSDLEHFAAFLAETYQDRPADLTGLQPRERC
jgi:selenocysteine lyase/cysteine desulfurase